MATKPDFISLVSALAADSVEFILVGALASVVQGAPMTTFDVDIVHRRTETNVDKLMRFLERNHAYFRGQPADRRLPPSREALLTAGHSLLVTDLGPLDALGSIEGGRDYESLLPHCEQVTVAHQVISVLKLEILAELKRGSLRAKDKLALAIIEETIKRRRPR